MNTPLVSIVVPVYNSEKTISKCLDSLISQTFKNIEIICVNDCSKDNSLQVLNEYASKDSRIVVINHKKNMNAGGARNSGIKTAKGEYICFVDNDDWISPNAMELLVKESECLSVDIVAPDWCEWFSEQKKIYHSNLMENVSKEVNCEFVLKYGCRILGCLIKREIFFKNNLFYPENMFWEDNAISASLFYSAKRLKAVKTVLYYYYVSPDSSSRSFNLLKTSDRIKTTQMAYDNLKRLGFITQRNRDLVEYRILCFSYFTIRMLSMNAGNEARSLLKEVIDIISPILPNQYLKQIHREYVFTLTFPKLAYYLWALAYYLRKLIKSY